MLGRIKVSLVAYLLKWMFTHLKPIIADYEQTMPKLLEFFQRITHVSIDVVSFDMVSHFTSTAYFITHVLCKSKHVFFFNDS